MTKVFLDYTQKALDDAYDQALWAPNRDQLLKRFAANSDLARKVLGSPEKYQYGPSAIETLDVYKASKAKAPVNVFIHGGAWRAGLARDYAFPAETFVRAGAHYVAVDFNNVLETGGDLMPMAEQVKRAIAWVASHCDSFGGNEKQIYVSAHSSGAHLAACAATTDWEREFGLPADCVKGYVLSSGMYDLRGPRLSKRSEYVRFTDAVEEALSPQRHLDRIRAPLVLACGSLETPEFRRQPTDFAAALAGAGRSTGLLVAEGSNHFEIAETLASPYGILGRAALRQMGLP